MNLTQTHPENTALVLDSTADFPDAQIRYPNMRVVPLYVRFGEESFRDYVELDPHGFYERLRAASELPTTSQPTPRDFIAVYQALAGYERVYSLHISAKLSGTFQRASLAAAENGDRVRLVDTESASVGIGCSRSRSRSGSSGARPTRRWTRSSSGYRERAGMLFTVDTLEYLAKGGRIGRARGAHGQLLNVKPILAIRTARWCRSTGCAGREGVRGVPEALRGGDRRLPRAPVGIAHAEAEDAVEQLREIVLASRPRQRSSS